MPLPLCRKLQLQDMKPIHMTIQLANRSIRRPVGTLKDVPILAGKFLIPSGFVVIDIYDSSHVPIILGRPFLTTVGVVVNVAVGRIFLHLCESK